MTNERLFELLSFEDELESVEIISEKECVNNATFIRAALHYPDFDMKVPFVYYEGQDWIFTPCDWQRWLPETSEEVRRIDWRVNDTDEEGVMWFGFPMLAPWAPEPNGGKIEDIRVVVGRMVKECREKAGMSVRELAEKAGMSHSHIVRIEAGRYNVTIETIDRLGKVLGFEFQLV